jgi:hypothetical protein
LKGVNGRRKLGRRNDFALCILEMNLVTVPEALTEYFWT